MKFNIEGFDQKNAMKFNLDCIDLIILRYFVDFKDEGTMVTKIIDNKEFYWLKYEGILRELPILNMKKDTIYKRLKKMVSNEILEHKTVYNKGTYSFYRLGPNYRFLVNSKAKRVNLDSSDSNPKGYRFKSEGVQNLIREGTDFNPDQKILLLKDSSIKDSSIYSSVINYLNEVVGTNYKSTSKKTQSLIRSRQIEGYDLDDFKRVIEIKAKEWINTEYAKYLRPETLFGAKFENYLNQKGCNNSSLTGNKSKELKFSNYEQRDTDYDSMEDELFGWDE